MFLHHLVDANIGLEISPHWTTVGNNSLLIGTFTRRAKIDNTNVIEIEGLLFLGFGQMRALLGKLVFQFFPSTDITRALKKWSPLAENF